MPVTLSAESKAAEYTSLAYAAEKAQWKLEIFQDHRSLAQNVPITKYIPSKPSIDNPATTLAFEYMFEGKTEQISGTWNLADNKTYVSRDGHPKPVPPPDKDGKNDPPIDAGYGTPPHLQVWLRYGDGGPDGSRTRREYRFSGDIDLSKLMTALEADAVRIGIHLI